MVILTCRRDLRWCSELEGSNAIVAWAVEEHAIVVFAFEEFPDDTAPRELMNIVDNVLHCVLEHHIFGTSRDNHDPDLDSLHGLVLSHGVEDVDVTETGDFELCLRLLVQGSW